MDIRAVGALLLHVAPAFSASYHFKALWDGDQLYRSVCVNTHEDWIESIGAYPPNAIDMSRYTAIPGLIDVHTHMTNLRPRNPVSEPGRDAAIVYLAASHARKTLETGVTKVRDLGVSRNSTFVSVASGYRSFTYPDIAMRDLINAGLMTGPRMFVAGYGLQVQRGALARANRATRPNGGRALRPPAVLRQR